MLPYGFSPLPHMISFWIIIWLFLKSRQADTNRAFNPVIVSITSTLLVLMLLATGLGLYDVYYQYHARFLPIVIVSMGFTAIVLNFIILAIVRPEGGPFYKLKRFIQAFIENVSLVSLMRIHGLRILAVGTVYKYIIGELPGHFVLPAGVPDFLFGISALFLPGRIAKASKTIIITWNALGILIFLSALFFMQLSIPGPLLTFTGEPTTREVISFPMSMVPSFVGPLFIALHTITIIKVIRVREFRKG